MVSKAFGCKCTYGDDNSLLEQCDSCKALAAMAKVDPTEMPGLLPCPCGQPAMWSQRMSSGKRSIHCLSQDCQWNIVGFVDELMAQAWNRRGAKGLVNSGQELEPHMMCTELRLMGSEGPVDLEPGTWIYVKKELGS